VAGQDVPHALRAEIVDILGALSRTWPHGTTINYAAVKDLFETRERVERYIGSIQWLTDRGLITFEALAVDSRGVALSDAILTPRGRDYARTMLPRAVNGSPAG
jgi:hypothetical protein